MPKFLPRVQSVMAAITAAMILWTGYLAFEASRLLRLAERPVRDTAVADLGALVFDVKQTRAALARGRETPAALEGFERQLDAQLTDAVAPASVDPESQAARASLWDAVLDLRFDAPDLAGPAALPRLDEQLHAVEAALGDVIASTSITVGAEAASGLAAVAAEIRRTLILLAGTGLCAAALITAILRRARALHRLARRDSLTGLQNRLTLSEDLEAVLRAPRSRQRGGPDAARRRPVQGDQRHRSATRLATSC